MDHLRDEDDWRGLSSAAERRKIQNRLSQRTYRKNRRARPHRNDPKPQNVALSTANDVPASMSNPCPRVAVLARAGITRRIRSIQQMTSGEVQQFMRYLETQFHDQYLLGSPRADQLLTLVQFNVLRALFSNASAIDCPEEWCVEEAISPWCRPSREHVVTCPISLAPTSLQQATEHHPWIDLFPFPRLRDNLLLADETYDEYALCNDLVDFVDVTHDRTGLLVWSDPWRPSSWEASETFLQKWPWVTQGCSELAAATNYWRGLRGEDELAFGTL